MTPQELAVFRQYQGCIVKIATILAADYAQKAWLNAADAPDFYQTVLLEAPAVLLELYEDDWGDEDAIRGFLFGVFRNRLRDLHKQARRESRYMASYALKQDDSDSICRMEVGEDSGKLAKDILAALIPYAPRDVQALCRAYVQEGSWAAAGKRLGWSNGKLNGVLCNAKKFFKGKCKFFGEFVELLPKRV